MSHLNIFDQPAAPWHEFRWDMPDGLVAAPGFVKGSLRKSAVRTAKDSTEIIERAVHVVDERRGPHETQWVAVVSNAGKIGCTVDNFRRRLSQRGRDGGKRDDLTTH